MAYLDMEGARNEGVLPKVQRTTAATRLRYAPSKLAPVGRQLRVAAER
jgi:hypothetical protein